jgi:hypothetical protein
MAKNTKQKTVYQLARDEMDISREKASELTGLEPYRIERIENEKMEETPWDVVAMAEAYKKPELCNHYCANKCPIGEKFVPEVPVKDLSQVVLELLASLNAMQKRKDLLIEITADGKIGKEELPYCFREFAPYEGTCRFNGCAHYKEPGCGVRQAVEAGEIARSRYESYCMLYEEVAAQKLWK